MWSDTQIDPVRDGNADADDPMPLEPCEQEAMLDLSLEEPAATPPAVGGPQPVDLQAATAVPDDTAPAVGRANAPPPPPVPPLTDDRAFATANGAAMAAGRRWSGR